MLVWDLVSNSLVVLANGTNLIRQTEGKTDQNDAALGCRQT